MRSPARPNAPGAHPPANRRPRPVSTSALGRPQRLGGARRSTFSGPRPSFGGLTLSLPLPVGTYRLTSAYGPRVNPVTRKEHTHNGQDLAAPEGTPVYAAAGGVVAKVYRDHPVNGNAVILGHVDSRITGTGYLHLSEVGVRTGQIVRTGEQIGRVGSTGRSTGPHLHFIVYVHGKAANPVEFLSTARPRTAPAAVATWRLWPWALALGAVALGGAALYAAKRRAPAREPAANLWSPP